MWDILGIEPTTDLEEIKRAYSALLPKYHPEDDPEGYQRLRQAFDFARKYVKRHKGHKEEFFYHEEIHKNNKDLNLSNNEEILIEYDTNNEKNSRENSIDKIMNQIVDLYNDYFRRIDIENWKNLFANDVLLNFEMVDDINIILLKFLVKNYVIPQEIWKYLNSIFDWESQYTILRKHFDRNTIESIFAYINEEQFINCNVDWNIENFNYDYYIRLRFQAYIAMGNNNLELAYSNMKKAYELYKDDGILIRMLCEYFKRVDEPNKGYHMAHKLVNLGKVPLEGYGYRAYFALILKHYNCAIEDCDAIIEGKSSQEAYAIKAKSYLGLNQLLKAKETLDKGLEHYNKDIQLYGLSMTVESLIEEEKKINEEFKKEVKKRSKQQKLDRNNNMTTKEKFIRYVIMFSVAIALVIAVIVLYLPIIKQTIEPKTVQINNEYQDKNTIVNRPISGPKVKFNRFSLVYIVTISGDMKELMGYDGEASLDNKISFFIFNYKEDDINYLLQFNRKEMEQYENGDDIIEYTPKDMVLNKHKVVDLINSSMEFKLDENNTYMFDMLKE
jgi:hypothetical protein